MRSRTSKPAHEDSVDAGSSDKPQGHTLVSLLLIVHLFLVLVGLGGNFEPSPLTQRLLATFAFYTRALNFDLNFTPYYLTHAAEHDVDHRIEVLPEGKDAARDEDWIVLPSQGFRGGERHKRYQRLGFTLAFFADDEVTAGLIAQSIGTSFVRNGVVPSQVRSRRHALQPIDALTSSNRLDRDPNSPGYFRVPYAANCLLNKDRTVGVVKIEEASQVARPSQDSGR